MFSQQEREQESLRTPKFLSQTIIDTAHRNAYRDRAFYRIFFQEDGDYGVWHVEHKGREKHRRYQVDAFEWTCTCYYFAKHHFCKHCVMVKEELFAEMNIDFFLADEQAKDQINAKYEALNAECCNAPNTPCSDCWEGVSLPAHTRL